MEKKISIESVNPRPFSSAIKIEFMIDADYSVSMYIIRISPVRIIRTLINKEMLSAGKHVVEWDGKDDFGKDVSIGNYVCRVEAGNSADTYRFSFIPGI